MSDASDVLFRSLEGCDVEIREAGDGRTLSGILVPYDAPQFVSAPGFRGKEEFVSGAFDDQVRALTPARLAGMGAPRIPLARDHVPLGGTIIGGVTNLRNDAKGLYGEARVSNTSMGNDTLELMNDGVLREWSIGFKPLQNRTAGDVTQRIKAHLTELAIVMQGAYGASAAVSSIRSACPACAELAQARADVEAPPAEPAALVVANLTAAARLVASLPLLPL